MENKRLDEIDQIYYTTEEVANSLKLKLSTIQKYCKNGIIPSVKIGSQYRILETDFNKWLEAKRNENIKRD